MLANCPKRKQQTAYVITGEKKDPCGLCRHGLQKQVMNHSVSLNEVTLSAHSIIFSSPNVIVQTVEKVKFNALLK